MPAMPTIQESVTTDAQITDSQKLNKQVTTTERHGNNNLQFKIRESGLEIISVLVVQSTESSITWMLFGREVTSRTYK